MEMDCCAVAEGPREGPSPDLEPLLESRVELDRPIAVVAQHVGQIAASEASSAPSAPHLPPPDLQSLHSAWLL